MCYLHQSSEKNNKNLLFKIVVVYNCQYVCVTYFKKCDNIKSRLNKLQLQVKLFFTALKLTVKI